MITPAVHRARDAQPTPMAPWTLAATLKKHALRLLATLWILGAVAPTARAEVNGDDFNSKRWKISLKLPRNWQATEKTSYPSILLWLVNPNPRARMLLAAEKVPVSLDSQRYAAKTIENLESLGFETRTPQLHPATGAYWVDYNNKTRFLRSAVLVFENRGYALTLAADSPESRSKLLRAFDATLRSISPTRD